MEHSTRRQFLSAAAASLGGVAAADAVSAKHTTNVHVGLYRAPDVSTDAMWAADEALRGMGAQIPNAEFVVDHHPDVANVSPDYDDASWTVRQLEQVLGSTTDHLASYDVLLFLYDKTPSRSDVDEEDKSVDRDEMTGAGFSLWQWGEPVAEPNYTHIDEGMLRLHDLDPDVDAGNYGVACVNAALLDGFLNTVIDVTGTISSWTPGFKSETAETLSAVDTERLFKNTVVHEVGHTFGLNHGVQKYFAPEDSAGAVYDEPGTVVEEGGTYKATPMGTWYADDLPVLSNDSDDRVFCRPPVPDVTEYTGTLSDCSVAELRDWVDRYGAPRVEGVRPVDVDGDGLARDVTGNGAVTQTDVNRFFENQYKWQIAEHPGYFDYSGNGSVGHGDVVELFEYVATQ